jgi:arylsulfatase A-like enzyme
MSSVARVCLLALLGGLIQLPAGSVPSAAAMGPARPNVLVILSDDQRADTMGMMPRTLRWFQRQGTTFPNGYVTTPLCCPSRASIMTGQYVHNHDVANNSEATELDQTETLQRYLFDAGYTTGISGKFLNDWPIGLDPSYFHRWAIFNGGYRGRKFNVNGKVKKRKGYSTDLIRDFALTFLEQFERKDGRPWMLFVNPFAPHDPFTPAARHVKAKVPQWEPTPNVGEADRSDKPPGVLGANETADSVQDVRTKQLRTLLAADELVRAILRELGKLGERQSTLAFYTSDNGFFWAEHGLYDKRWPYTESIHVPLFMRWPGRVAAGATDQRQAMSVDIPATVFDATGITPQHLLDGRSLLDPPGRERMLIEHFVDPLQPWIPEWASTRTPTYQYVEYYDEAGAISFREYYDLVADPWQLANILEDGDPSNDPSGGELADLSTQLEQDRQCAGTSGPAACP